jgi:uncharacterized protein (DUF2141 family)
MLKKLLAIGLMLCMGAGLLLADEAKGKFQKSEKGTITVKVGDKDVEFKLGKDTKVLNGDEEVKGKDRGTLFKNLKPDTEVTVTFTKDGDKTTVTEFKIKK